MGSKEGRMNYFLQLKIWDKDRTVYVRPEHVASVERRDDDPYLILTLASGNTYLVEPAQFVLNTLINRTTHAGMRVL
jgi:hypothetical protein